MQAKLKMAKQIAPAKNWFFTLNNYSDNDISILLNHPDINKYCFQEEKGENGTPHLQGCIEFKTKVRPVGKFENKGFHWEKTKSVKAAIEYCSKIDTRNGKTYNKGYIIPKPLKLIKSEQLYEWQLFIMDILKSEPDDRSIYWFYETVGSVGKSQFAKYVAVTMQGIYLSGKAADMKYALVKYNENNGEFPEIVIIDIPRYNIDYLTYGGIEEIKNGIFFSTKYESTQAIFNSPHVIIFANSPPKLENMSMDRWNVYRIGCDNKLYKE